MNKFKYIVLLACALQAPGAGAQEETTSSGKLLDNIVAIVNEGVVLRSELNRQITAIEQRAKNADMKLPPADVISEQVLERLIVEEVQLQRANRLGIAISDQQVNITISQVAVENNIKFEELPDLLAKDGIVYSDYRNEIRRQLVMEQLRRIEVIARIAVSTREIDQCIADIEDNVVVNSEYNLSHILISVPPSASSDQIAEAQAKANNVFNQLNDGSDFSEMAVRHSSGPSALEGGALGWLKGNELPTLFFDIMNELEPGQISKPVRNVSGFHLVKINDLRSAVQHSEIEQTKVRHILIIPNQIIDDATAKQRLEGAIEQLNAGEDFAELAKLMSDDPGSANSGGEMGWSGPGTFVPEFENVANSSEIGVVSEPFRSQFGWHILEVVDRRTYDNTEDLKASNCINRIRNSKLANETELWVRRLRDEAYVELRI